MLEKWQDQAKTLHREGRYVVVAEHPVFGILEIACWLVGYEQIMLSLAGDRDFCRVLFDRILEIQLAIGEQYYKALGPYIDLTISGDDFGTQNGPFISARMFAELITPYFRERIRRIKDVAGCLFWHHSCGSVFRLIPELIRCGVDILNPVQTSAFEMEPQRLKDAYGDRIVFWGGVDVQKLLPDASPDEVRSHVNELIRVLGRDGGYVVAPAHVMQDGIPAENVMAWVETVRDARME
ncbi:MAG: hypothetical protein HZA50_04985 [Planctomycetes bacterium]|nr:hypothetical protein [Planctomycetota bacterium]